MRRGLLVLAVLVLLPLPALASGFYAPWWFEWLLLLFTPAGLVTVLAVVVAIALIYKATR